MSARFLDWQTWLYGLISTLINGVASGVVLIIADPVNYNIWDGREKLVTVSLVMGLLCAANYLKAHPLPEAKAEP